MLLNKSSDSYIKCSIYQQFQLPINKQYPHNRAHRYLVVEVQSNCFEDSKDTAAGKGGALSQKGESKRGELQTLPKPLLTLFFFLNLANAPNYYVMTPLIL